MMTCGGWLAIPFRRGCFFSGGKQEEERLFCWLNCCGRDACHLAASEQERDKPCCC